MSDRFSELVEISKLNGDFKKNYGKLIGAYTLAGGAGNDALSGGAGNDMFVFRAGLGQDTVTDFTPGQDVLDIRDGIFADAAAALAAATASGNNTLITIDANNSILLQNVALANLHASDFHIV